MDWYPLRLTTPVKQHVFGGRAIPDRLARAGLPAGRIAETWEVSDVDGDGAHVREGPLAGTSLRELTEREPDGLVGRGRRVPRFPLLTKFIDAAGPLPVHLHADDEAARGQGEPNGKTEAWHILDAEPGATALVGVEPGVDRERLRLALLEQDFDAVMRRLPVRAGLTLYVPAGTLHSFGPGTLVYEIEQTSDLQEHAMRHRMEDGAALGDAQWHTNVDALLDQWKPDPRPEFVPGLRLPAGDGVVRVILCAGPYFALERWQVRAGARLDHAFTTALVLSNAGAPVSFTCGDRPQELDRAQTVLLPAALGRVRVHGPADVLVGYLPDLEHDIRRPLAGAGYGPVALSALGEGLS
ncbi:class I mannose-6-phosphate isomerase [Streptomyces sp. Wb2n-11]|uniref:class I mannose-6-phosphate isomerase n=1 Tax=Streptomyces sp. Wb2n-11 TaxID=1030533 RepID=UPI000B2C24C3|nr:class I mannose-6-phosphate isomerase [Streptomyces sp. Wb2n-11]